MLTNRQRQTLDIIARYNRDHGIGPSYEEIAAALVPPVQSKSSVHRWVQALILRGFVRKKGGVRSLEAVQPPAVVSPSMVDAGSQMLLIELADLAIELPVGHDPRRIAAAVYDAMSRANRAVAAQQ